MPPPWPPVRKYQGLHTTQSGGKGERLGTRHSHSNERPQRTFRSRHSTVLRRAARLDTTRLYLSYTVPQPTMPSSYRFAVLRMTCLVATVLAQPSCCPFGGVGSVVLNGLAVVDAFPSADPNARRAASVQNTTILIDKEHLSVAVIFNATTKGAEGSGAGWVITQNATSQTLSFWYNATAPTGIVCYRTSVLLPDTFVVGFSACTGDNVGTFPHYKGSYSPSPGLTIESWADKVDEAQSTMNFATTASECSPLTLLASGNPFGGGAWAVSVHKGSSVPAPVSWSVPPAACKFL